MTRKEAMAAINRRTVIISQGKAVMINPNKTRRIILEEEGIIKGYNDKSFFIRVQGKHNLVEANHNQIRFKKYEAKENTLICQ